MRVAEDPRVEWVLGPRGWWVPVWGPLIAVTPVVALSLVYFGQGLASNSPSAALYSLLPVLVLVVALGCSLALRWWLPSVRRLGITPSGLIFDIGLQFRYPWAQIYRVSRTPVTRHVGDWRSAGIRTRVQAESSLGTRILIVTLSARQGDRLAQVLGLK